MHKKAMEMAKCAINDACTKGYDNMTSQDWDDFKDCMEVVEKAIKADYYYHIIEEMDEYKKEEEEEAKYIMKKMKEKYGDEEGERRFYDNYRYKTSGRFAPKGKGSYMPIRGYEEMPYMMMPQVHNPMEWDRDMDRMDGRMYFPNRNGSNDNMSGSMGGNTRGYSDGYSDGLRDGKSMESRYDKVKRGYEEVKQAHNKNTPEDKQLTMRETEKMIDFVLDEIDEMLDGTSPEVKNLVKTKTMSRLQKIQ